VISLALPGVVSNYRRSCNELQSNLIMIKK
jgi:hypothetical protein